LTMTANVKQSFPLAHPLGWKTPPSFAPPTAPLSALPPVHLSISLSVFFVWPAASRVCNFHNAPPRQRTATW